MKELIEKLRIDIGSDYVRIYDESNTEVVGWIIDEWIEDPTVCTAIARAVELALTNPKSLRKTIGKEL